MIYKKLLLLIILTLIVGEFGNYILDIEEIWKIKLLENYSTVQIENIFKIQEKWQWLSYLFISSFLFIKSLIITSIIYIGTYFYSKVKVTFKQLWHIVVVADFIFLLVAVFRIIWFYFFQTNYTLEDIQYFYPLSALNIVGYKGLDTWLLYPLQTLNLFEVAYIIYLSHQIGSLTKTNTDNGLKIVSYSYLPALLLWVTVVMFFTLNYS